MMMIRITLLVALDDTAMGMVRPGSSYPPINTFSANLTINAQKLIGKLHLSSNIPGCEVDNAKS